MRLEEIPHFLLALDEVASIHPFTKRATPFLRIGMRPIAIYPDLSHAAPILAFKAVYELRRRGNMIDEKVSDLIAQYVVSDINS